MLQSSSSVVSIFSPSLPFSLPPPSLFCPPLPVPLLSPGNRVLLGTGLDTNLATHLDVDVPRVHLMSAPGRKTIKADDPAFQTLVCIEGSSEQGLHIKTLSGITNVRA